MNFGNILIYSATFVGLYASLFFLLTIFRNRHSLYLPPQTKQFPTVSILVPCYNEEKTISKTIQSLLALDYPQDKLHILVIDDGSKDKTFAVAKQFEKYGPVTVYHKENGGKYTALNYGLKKVQTEFVGTLDADSFVDPQSLRKMVPYFQDSSVQAVTSSMKVYQPKTIFQHLQNIEYIFGIYLRKALSLIGSIKVTPGPLTLFRRSVFDTIGYYHRAYDTEDLEIALRLQTHNFQIENAVDAYVYTVAPASFKALYHQRVRWYQGLLRNAYNYRHLLSYRHGNLGLFVLPTTFLGIIFLFSLSAFTIVKLTTQTVKAFTSWEAIGFDFSQIHFHFDWFFLNSHLMLFLSLASISLTLLAIVIGQKLSKGSFSKEFGKGIIIDVLLYGPLYLIWWLGATLQVLFHRHPHWTQEKEIS